jgi:hypothetical protein
MWKVLAALYGPVHVQLILRNGKEVCEFVVYVPAFYQVHSIHGRRIENDRTIERLIMLIYEYFLSVLIQTTILSSSNRFLLIIQHVTYTM